VGKQDGSKQGKEHVIAERKHYNEENSVVGKARSERHDVTIHGPIPVFCENHAKNSGQGEIDIVEVGPWRKEDFASFYSLQHFVAWNNNTIKICISAHGEELHSKQSKNVHEEEQ
jgi:hypothetical protein